jgi:flagellar hook-associated protein 3 FlgL
VSGSNPSEGRIATMSVRITPAFLFQQTVRLIQSHFERLTALQQQAATGKRLQKPSDAPADVAFAEFLHSEVKQWETRGRTVREAESTLELTVSTLRDAAALFSRARQILVQANHSVMDKVSYEALAREVDQLRKRLLDLANTQLNGRYLFAGADVRTVPFIVTAQSEDGFPIAVQYAGSEGGTQFVVGDNLFIQGTLAGDVVFLHRETGEAFYSGATGAKPGMGTDSATGRTILQVRHTSTAYEAGSGVAPGASSVAGDTIIGPTGAHTLFVDDTSGIGASGVVSLNGGPAVAFTSADTDLKVTGPNGEVVYLDMSSVTPGFTGTVNITASGTLSIDGGVSEVPIDFTGAQMVTDSATGEVIFVDSTEIRRTGTELIDHYGRYDAFQLLAVLAEDLRAAAGRTSSLNQTLFGRHLRELDRIREHLLDVVGERSAALETLAGLKNRSDATTLELARLLEHVEGADIAEVIVQLRAQEASLQLALGATARLLDLSLLDFLD